MAFCLFSQNKLSGGRESVLLSVRESGFTMGKGLLNLSIFSGPAGNEGREGRGEDCSRSGFHLRFLWSQNLIVSLGCVSLWWMPWSEHDQLFLGLQHHSLRHSTTPGAEGLERRGT